MFYSRLFQYSPLLTCFCSFQIMYLNFLGAKSVKHIVKLYFKVEDREISMRVLQMSVLSGYPYAINFTVISV